jgi:hypothetical protein
MPHLRSVWIAPLVVLAVGLACENPLRVENSNEPDRNRALSSPADVEALIGASYATVHQGTLGGISLVAQLQTMGLENYSTLANFNMGPRGAVPRSAIINDRGNPGQDIHFRDFTFMHRAAWAAAQGYARLNIPGFTLGSAGRDARARAFARFAHGAALGNLALAYDSGGHVTENDVEGTVPPLLGYNDLRDAALGYLDEAIAIAQANGSGFPLPANWMNGNPLSRDDFVRLVRSYKARFRAGVARTPAERAAVGWAAVIADAENGIQSDFQIEMNSVAGWQMAWVGQHFVSANWHQMWQFMLGMADTSGAYSAWLNTAPGDRVPFVVVTPDRRFPQGVDRPTQQANSPRGALTGEAAPPVDATPYFRNRPSGEDQPGDPIGISMYDFWRTRLLFNTANQAGVRWSVMTKAEMDLLRAEGLVRTGAGNIPAALALIDVSRVGKGQLPSLVAAGITDTLTAVPGGSACVPKVPDPATSFKSAKCGNIMEALKWEYRMETAFTGYGMWYFAGRGWGDLPEGTAYHWPVPYQEMDARREPFYDLGGVGGPASLGRGTYGLFSGGVF